MPEKNGMMNGLLLTGNLLLAGALFLCVLYRYQDGNRRRRLLTGAGYILEFAVYSAGMIKFSDLIVQGIRAGGECSVSLTVVRLLLAESMSALFLFASIYFSRSGSQKIKGIDSKIKHDIDGEFYIGNCLLLWMTHVGWNETDLWKGFGKQVLYLEIFFVLEYFRARRLRIRKGLSEKNTDSQRELTEAVYRGRQAEYLKNVDTQYQRTRELWHDLKNHIGIMEILAGEGRLTELSDYLGCFRQDVECRMIPMRSGCAAVDALLGDKSYCAGRKGIPISLELCDLSDMAVEATELCVILGNLLDNALEACERLPQKGRISLNMKRLEDFYYLTVVNSSKEPLQQEGRYISGKKGRDNGVGHGLGLRSVERIAHQYGGSMVTAYEEGEFRTIVRLQNPNSLIRK